MSAALAGSDDRRRDHDDHLAARFRAARVVGGERAEIAAPDFLVQLGELARDRGFARPKPGREIGRASRQGAARFRTARGWRGCAPARQSARAVRFPWRAGSPRRRTGRSAVPPRSAPSAPRRGRARRSPHAPPRWLRAPAGSPDRRSAACRHPRPGRRPPRPQAAPGFSAAPLRHCGRDRR